MDVRSLLGNLDPLKLLVEYDDDDHAFVAYCVDTGAVATGATTEQALESLQDVLRNDIAIAVRTNSLASLLNCSAPGDVRARWVEAKSTSPDTVRTIELEIPSSGGDEQPRRGVKSELRYGKTKKTSAA